MADIYHQENFQAENRFRRKAMVESGILKPVLMKNKLFAKKIKLQKAKLKKTQIY